MYILKQVSEKNVWNDFVISNFNFYSFLDSWQWGDFNALEGNQVFRFGIYKEGSADLLGLIMLIFVDAKRGKYFFTPHGPLIKENYFEVLKSILIQISNFAKEKKVCFYRINTLSLNTKINKANYKKIGFIDAPMHVHAENTHLLDLTLSEEKLMSNLRKTTRYLINRAKKEGVQIVEDNSNEGIEDLMKMHLQHSKRSNGKRTYSAFSESYINNLLKTFDKDQILVLRAIYNGNTEAMLLTIKFGSNCVYYIGASDVKHPEFSPAYLLQWSAIIHAKNSGCTLYNFWGVSPDSNPKHPIQGVSLFKRGFGGYDYDLLHAQDYIIDFKRYCINYLVETFRRRSRGYYYKDPE